MSIADQLKTLDELRQSGALSKGEFEVASESYWQGMKLQSVNDISVR